MMICPAEKIPLLLYREFESEHIKKNGGPKKGRQEKGRRRY
jgi:hypothetical protein